MKEPRDEVNEQKSKRKLLDASKQEVIRGRKRKLNNAPSTRFNVDLCL
jgi:hypothetical protein